MRMPTYRGALKHSAEQPAFANGTEGDEWMRGWCLREGAYCKNDSMQRGGDVACPLLDVALLKDRTPSEWADPKPALGPDAYRCTRYEAE